MSATLDPRVAELAMLVRRLTVALCKANPRSAVAAQATEYLHQYGLHGEILRTDNLLKEVTHGA